MVGQLFFSEERRGGAVEIQPALVCGMAVWRVTVRRSGRIGTACRRLKRAGRLLQKSGVTLLLVPEEFQQWDILSPYGLRSVPVAPLLQGLAAEIALAYLSARGILPGEAAVCLAGERVTPTLYAAAVRLARTVRYLALDVENGGDALASGLQYSGGIPPVPRGTRCDVTLCFSHVEGKSVGLPLYDEANTKRKFTLSAPEVLPWEYRENLEVLALLWDRGLLKPMDMVVICGETA